MRMFNEYQPEDSQLQMSSKKVSGRMYTKNWKHFEMYFSLGNYINSFKIYELQWHVILSFWVKPAGQELSFWSCNHSYYTITNINIITAVGFPVPLIFGKMYLIIL